MLSCDARNTAWVSFDGRKRQEICHGDRLVYMLPRLDYMTKQSPLIRDKKFNSLGCCINTYRLSYVTWATLTWLIHRLASVVFLLLQESSQCLKNMRTVLPQRGLHGFVFPQWNVSLCDAILYSRFSITITTSCFPVPSICFRDPVNDWFESLAQCLHWNVRKKQNYLSSEDEFWALWSLQDSVLICAWPCTVPFYLI